MEITVDENKDILLTDVYNPIRVQTKEGVELSFCMRDGTFEIYSRDTSISKLWERYIIELGSISYAKD